MELSISGFRSRKAAWDVLQAVAAGAYAEVALDRVLKKYSLNDLDRGLMTELAYGAIRKRKYLDAWIDFLGKVPASKQPPLLRWLLHLGLYQIFEMDRIPSSAAVNVSVELAKKSQLKKLSPVVNAILRNAIRASNAGHKLPLKSSFSHSLAQEYSLPIWLSEKFISWRGEQGAESIAKASNKTPAFDLRVNRHRSNPTRLQREFKAVGIQSSLIEGFSDGLQVESGLSELRSWPGYKEGFWCVQDRSSQWVSPLLDPQPGEKILDACAAPGCKTTHLVELMSDKGELWAVDRSKERLCRVLENANRLGANCLNTLTADASKLISKMPTWKRYFHRILLDAPCSGLGTLARNADARWRISPKKIDELVTLQFELLEGVIPLLRPGGRLVYSTCTINPLENFQQVENFIASHPELILREEKQLWPEPYKEGDGFYAAVMELRQESEWTQRF